MRFSHWALSGVLILGAAGLASAQQETLEQKLEKKMNEPYMKAAPWITDFDQAREEARKTGKLIFGYFNRSYAY